MNRIDGIALAARRRAALKTLIQTNSVTPVLASVLVGDDPASLLYVKKKAEAAAEIGITVHHHSLPAATSQKDVLMCIKDLNATPSIHGILVQLPLPAHLDTDAVIAAMDPAKDVDGFHPENLKRLASGNERWLPVLVEATLALIAETPRALSGARAVVIGKNDVFLAPFAAVFPRFGATITMLHAPDAAQTNQADIIITALGVPGSITAGHVRDGAVVIDIGITKTEGGVAGDVDENALTATAGWLTPVPGGVGPVTIAVLLEHVARAADLAVHPHPHA